MKTPSPAFNHEQFTEICQKAQTAINNGISVAFTADRVSSADQSDNTSLTYQNERGFAYADQKGFLVIFNDSFVESASKEDRPYFFRYMDYARRLKKMFPVLDLHLIFKSTDRFARNIRDLGIAEQLFKTQSICLHLYEEGLVLRPDGNSSETLRFLLNGVIAKSETDRLSERVTAAFNLKRSLGMKPGPTCWGFRYVKKPEMKHIIDKEAEPYLRRIFDLFDENDWTLPEAVEYFNARGIYNKAGKPWTKGNLRKFLGNPNYHGEHETQDGQIIALNPERHERYYEKGRYEERIKKLGARRTHNRSRKARTEWQKGRDRVGPLGGFVHCSECGKHYSHYETTKKNGKVYAFYKHACPRQEQSTDSRNEVIATYCGEDRKPAFHGCLY